MFGCLASRLAICVYGLVGDKVLGAFEVIPTGYVAKYAAVAHNF